MFDERVQPHSISEMFSRQNGELTNENRRLRKELENIKRQRDACHDLLTASIDFYIAPHLEMLSKIVPCDDKALQIVSYYEDLTDQIKKTKVQ